MKSLMLVAALSILPMTPAVANNIDCNFVAEYAEVAMYVRQFNQSTELLRSGLVEAEKLGLLEPFITIAQEAANYPIQSTYGASFDAIQGFGDFVYGECIRATAD